MIYASASFMQFAMHDDQPYHRSCYKEFFHPKCDVCNNFVSVHNSSAWVCMNVFIALSLCWMFYMFFFTRFQQIEMALSSTGRILSGCKSTAPHMKMMALLGAAAVNEWRSVQGFISINQNSSPWLACTLMPMSWNNSSMFLYLPGDILLWHLLTLLFIHVICFFHHEIQPREVKYITLDDGRKLCLECLNSAIMDTPECQQLYMDIQEYYEGLNMKVEQQVPLLLVERQALNEAMVAEKNVSVTWNCCLVCAKLSMISAYGYLFASFKGHHLPETRGLCLSEEQIVRTVSSQNIRASLH